MRAIAAHAIARALFSGAIPEGLSSGMKKDQIVPPMAPYTPDEEAALVEKLQALTAPALTQYVEAAHSALANSALAPSWRPRVEFGLATAQSALAKANAAAAAPASVGA
jgi:hypothetical protein